jgi:integrase
MDMALEKKGDFAGEKPNNIDIHSELESRKIENREKTTAKPMEKFLGSLSKSTMKSYRRGLELFIEFYGKDVETILAERKDDLTPRPNENLVDGKNRASRYENLLEEFHAWMLKPIHMVNKKSNQAYEINTARTSTLGLLQLFRYYNMGITLRNGSPISTTVISTCDFVLMPEHVRAMFHVAKDLRSKLLVSMGNDLGWRINDVLGIQRNELPSLDKETPIVWTRITAKEKQASKTCLSKTTVTLLKEYLFTFPSKNPFLFGSNGKNHIDEETVNNRLRDLAREANIEIGNSKLTWHCFRDMIISQGKNLGIDPDIINVMTGKHVNRAMLPYLTGIDVKTAFLKLQKITGITTIIEESETNIKKIENLENAIVENQKRTAILETTNQVLTQKMVYQEKQLEQAQKEIKRLTDENAQLKQGQGTISTDIGELKRDSLHMNKVLADLDFDVLEIQDKLHIKSKKSVKGEPDFT